MGKKNKLKKGDLIGCRDTEDLINTMQALAVEGIETDFYFERDGSWLQITKVKKSEREKALDDLIKELEEIDPCEFAMYSLCLIRELCEKIKEQKNE